MPTAVTRCWIWRDWYPPHFSIVPCAFILTAGSISTADFRQRMTAQANRRSGCWALNCCIDCSTWKIPMHLITVHLFSEDVSSLEKSPMLDAIERNIWRAGPRPLPRALIRTRSHSARAERVRARSSDAAEQQRPTCPSGPPPLIRCFRINSFAFMRHESATAAAAGGAHRRQS